GESDSPEHCAGNDHSGGKHRSIICVARWGRKGIIERTTGRVGLAREDQGAFVRTLFVHPSGLPPNAWHPCSERPYGRERGASPGGVPRHGSSGSGPAPPNGRCSAKASESRYLDLRDSALSGGPANKARP